MHIDCKIQRELSLDVKTRIIGVMEQSIMRRTLDEGESVHQRLTQATVAVLIETKNWEPYASGFCQGFIVFDRHRLKKLVDRLLRIVKSDRRYQRLVFLNCITDTSKRKRFPGGGRPSAMPEILDRALFTSMTRLTLLYGGFTRTEFEERVESYSAVLCPTLKIWFENSGTPQPPYNRNILKVTSVFLSRWRKRNYMKDASGDLTTATDPMDCINRGAETLVRAFAARIMGSISVHSVGNTDQSMFMACKSRTAKRYAASILGKSGHKKSQGERDTITLMATIYGTKFHSVFAVLNTKCANKRSFSSDAKGKLAKIGLQEGFNFPPQGHPVLVLRAYETGWYQKWHNIDHVASQASEYSGPCIGDEPRSCKHV